MCNFIGPSNPSPPHREVMDSISNFESAITRSLQSGTIRNCSFSVVFRTHAFNFLFNSKGTVVSGRKGRSYSLDDFDAQHFSHQWNVTHNRLEQGCKIVFPLYMYSSIKHTQASYTNTSTGVTKKPHDYTEAVFVTLVKSRC